MNYVTFDPTIDDAHGGAGNDSSLLWRNHRRDLAARRAPDLSRFGTIREVNHLIELDRDFRPFSLHADGALMRDTSSSEANVRISVTEIPDSYYRCYEPNLCLYSIDWMKALTLSAFTKFPLN